MLLFVLGESGRSVAFELLALSVETVVPGIGDEDYRIACHGRRGVVILDLSRGLGFRQSKSPLNNVKKSTIKVQLKNLATAHTT
jgi:hypothetical protein